MNKQESVQESAKVEKVKASSQFIADLYWRWLDEKEYEDIKDYGKALAKALGFDIQMTKKPFGFTFNHVRVTVKGGRDRADMDIHESCVTE